jgi:streptogramin lyase
LSTLVRLSFWLPDPPQPRFADAFEHHLRPVLETHGLTDPTPSLRPAQEGVFSRLFGIETPLAIQIKQQALEDDPAWHQALDLVFPNPSSWRLELYETNAGPGQRTPCGTGFRQAQWYTLTADAGLAAIGLGGSMCQDGRGQLWLSTGMGIVRFDGVTWHHFGVADGMAHASVASIMASQAGGLWIGSSGGVSYYDGLTFIHYTTADGLGFNHAMCLLEDRQGRIWAGNEKGLYVFEDQAFVPGPVGAPLSGEIVRSVLQDRQGDLWVGCHGALYWFGPNQTRVWRATDGLHGSVRALLEDQQGLLWIGTDQALYTMDQQRLSQVETTVGFAVCTVNALAEEPDGTLWYTQDPHGLGCYDGHRHRSYPTQNILSLLLDSEENLWMGMTHGLSRWDRARYTHFSREDGLPHEIGCDMVQGRDGRFWVSTAGGLTVFDGQAFQSIPELEGQNLWFVEEDPQGRVWSGGGFSDALYRLDNDQIEAVWTAQPPEAGPSRTWIDCQGRVWCIHTWFNLPLETHPSYGTVAGRDRLAPGGSG